MLKRYKAAVPRLSVDIIDNQGLLREGLVAWFSDNTEHTVIVGRFDSWAAVPLAGSLSDVVILEAFLGDHVPLRVKIEALRSLGSEVVVSSQLACTDVALQAYRAGARAFVPKSFSAQTLLMAVLAAARGEQTILPGFSMRLDSYEPGLRLSSREQEVVSLYLGQAMTKEQVGQHLGISVHTVKKCLVSARRKAGVGQGPGNRLVLRAILVKEGWLPPETPSSYPV